ncbi:MAG TPA: gluconate 2-dehydrogenase subunit 3 family protein [Ktedonobacteraceae bacterium]|nr:gluconate 2-dehydrogenase subunit 3 family protein [Ktedonobacteraceae bacterium]
MKEQEKSANPQRLFFDERQWTTIEAAMARIIPTDDTPGAREAGAIHFLDRYLSGLDYIYARPDGSGFMELHGKKADSWRERIETIRKRYLEGIQEMGRRSHDLFGMEFHLLNPEQQDRVLSRMEKPEVEADAWRSSSEQAEAGFAPSTPAAMQQYETETDLEFFQMLVLHTRQGFYADPIYGGNQNHVGWQTIGFSGPSSLAEAHSGTYNTLKFFADAGTGTEEGSKV